eukprot:scaffold242035_cov30-Tisochrysis_lutea.AAC.2
MSSYVVAGTRVCAWIPSSSNWRVMRARRSGSAFIQYTCTLLSAWLGSSAAPMRTVHMCHDSGKGRGLSSSFINVSRI